MAHKATIICDSVSPSGVRLTTFEVTFPRIVLAEFNTHRVFSRNSASSRAISVDKMLKMVEDEPYIPMHWGKNQSGMQADVELGVHEQDKARVSWFAARNDAVRHARRLLEIGVHKQITNRLLEPFLWHTVVVTSTEWSNFFNLRCHRDAHPEIRHISEMMRDLYISCQPMQIGMGQWHLPYVGLEERVEFAKLGVKAWCISSARCAAVSYLRQDSKNVHGQLALYNKLLAGGHMSPLEHPATPINVGVRLHSDVAYMDCCNNFWAGNFRGWFQHRKEIVGEENMLGHKKS